MPSMLRALLAVSAATACLASTQFPFQAPFGTSAFGSPTTNANDSDYYQFKWPIQKVAIIGAGVSGLLAYRQLVDAGLEVRVFERDAVPGGVWHYTEDSQGPAPVPNVDPVVADYAPSLPPHGVSLPHVVYHNDRHEKTGMTSAERWREHRAPHGVWNSLTSNVPAPLMKFYEHDWPERTPWRIPQQSLQRYLRSVYSFYGVNANDENPCMSYNTRVELIQKRFDAQGKERGWTLMLKKLEMVGDEASREEWWTEDFDAVVVATGTFNAPSMPNIPGLAEWKERYPETIVHSRQYRRPEMFANHSVLVVGAGTSGTGISADLNPFVKRNLLSWRQSERSNTPALFLNLLPQGVKVVVGIDRFHPDNRTIELADGTILSDIDEIIFATGYRYTFPFLPQVHNSSIKGPWAEGPQDQPQPVVTDGTHFRSLWFDLFYIDEPTLAFINQGLNVVTFTWGENLAIALARVWTGTARLPSRETMWAKYREWVKEQGGYGKWLIFPTSKRQKEVVSYYAGWLDSESYLFGGKRFVDDERGYFEILKVWMQAFFGNNNPVKLPDMPKKFGASAVDEGVDQARKLFEYFTSGY
ncbi:Dimethylaniline monooxygenase [Mycena chlorophos]|uniref:Dimethylaniline monooxygenase n=1 Tax=Mycena chlorophos TaxID=658473 RepID=A0A8H6TCL5_MYCCL|nr:Dimethylaniline monooxygenase [Mycena chlorophos]